MILESAYAGKTRLQELALYLRNATQALRFRALSVDIARLRADLPVSITHWQPTIPPVTHESTSGFGLTLCVRRPSRVTCGEQPLWPYSRRRSCTSVARPPRHLQFPLILS